MACQLLEVKGCWNCFYFNGEEGDNIQFCDDKEEYVHESAYCWKWKEKPGLFKEE